MTVATSAASTPPPSAPSPSAPAPDAARILGALHGRIEPVPVSALYQVGLFLVAVVMIILPMVYLALVAGAGYLVYWHATENVTIFEGRGNGKGKLLLYVGPLVIGSILVLFMIKPLFARRPKESNRLRVRRADEPILFDFIDRLCTVVGAPRPREIAVDCEPNASAGFRRGLWSLFTRDLTLTIGLPLAAALSLRQFTGILAHEFGHFAQGTGMRLTYLIRSINHWFARVVYERDAWDQNLDTWANETGWSGAAIVLHLSRGMVWLTRRVLWGLMWAGHLVSSFMLRQMEFDADRYEARVAGSDAFEQTCNQLPLLGVASQGAYQDLGHAWNARRLCDDLPALILANVAQLPPDLRREIEKGTRERKTGFFDSHPADADRIASARRENARGIIHVDLPATALFTNFKDLCREASMGFYRDSLGDQVNEHNLVATEQLCRAHAGEHDAHKSLRRFFQDQLTAGRLIFPRLNVEPCADPDAAKRQLLDARAQMESLLVNGKAAIAQLKAGEARIANVKHVRALSAAGFAKINTSAFDLPSADEHELLRATQRGAAERGQAERFFEPLEEVAARRIQAALQLAGCAGVDPSACDALDPDRVRRLQDVLEAVYRLHERIDQFRDDATTMNVLVANLETNPGHEPLFNRVKEMAEVCVGHMMALHRGLLPAAYPFEHAQSNISVAEYALGKIPSPCDVGDVFNKNGEVLNHLYSMYFRILATLAHAAEAVETALGLPKQPDPKDEPEQAAAAA